MGAAIIVAFINILILLFLIISTYSALRHKRGVVFRISCWTKSFISRAYYFVTKTQARKFGTLILSVCVLYFYFRQQKGNIAMFLPW
jgi:cbb3-type cytochrome oxidase subunit 3